MFEEAKLSSVLYSNSLDINKFENLISNNAQGYKFYWLGAIFEHIIRGKEEITFDQLVNEMIWQAWRTVTYYHLRLGPTQKNYTVNALEHIINTLKELNTAVFERGYLDRDKIYDLIKIHEDKIRPLKNTLTDFVPYRLIKPFLDEMGRSLVDKNQDKKLMEYMKKFSSEDNGLFYVIIDAKSRGERTIKVNSHWAQFIKDNYILLKGWLDYNKAKYIQDRNPGVPGIIYKLSPMPEILRKLKEARNLWVMTSELTNKPLYEIYTGNELDISNFDLDHFVPRSYVTNDELWNLVPMSKSLNCSKSNRLPEWEKYFKEFATYQYYLYESIFYLDKPKQDILYKQFEKCQKHNVNSIWALEKLYVKGNTKEEFNNILEENLKTIYNSAKLQNYEIWRI